MTLKQIKIAPLSELHMAAGKAILAQGEGANFSKMLENRLAAINKEIEKRNIDALVIKEKQVFIEKTCRELKENEKLIPIENYIHLNKRGKPCSRSWKHRLVKKDLAGKEKAPFEFQIKKDRTYVIINVKN